MNVLITGITGFVGSWLAEYCLKKGANVFGLVRWRSPLENINHIKNKLTLIEGDLLDPKSIRSMIEEVKPDKIFHLAAQSYVPFSWRAPNITFETNVIGSANLFHAVIESKYDPVILVCSTSEVYGEPTKEEIPITEKNPPRPNNPYGISKLAMDLLAQQYYPAHGLKTIITRAFTHTGPGRGDVFVTASFAKQIIEIEKGYNKPNIKVGNLESVRTFCDVKDIIEAYWLATEKCRYGEVYNIGGVETMTIGEMLKKLIMLSNIENKEKINIIVDEKLLRPIDVTLQLPSIAKFQNETGWSPTTPFSDTMKNILKHYREIL